MLYKILIGPKAIDLYNTLYSISKDVFEKEITFAFLKEAISDYLLDNDTLEDLFGYLKTLKLIDVKGEYDDDHLFLNWEITLYPPYSGEEFFKSFDMAFSKQLKYRSSKYTFKSLMRKFLSSDIEVPDLVSDKDKKLSSITKEIKFNKRKENMIPFSFGDFKKELENYYDVKDEDRDFFNGIANIYKYSLTEMMNILYKCVDNDVLDKDKFIKEAYNKFANEKPEFSKSSDDSSKEHIAYFKKADIGIILSNKNIKRLSDSDKNTIIRLKDELHLSDSFIALLLVYSLSTNNNKLSAFKYYETIVNDWENKRITTIDDAYSYICSLYSREYKQSTPKLSNQEWVDNYWNNFEENDKESANKKWVDDYWNNYDENKDNVSSQQKFVDDYWNNEGGK